MTTCAPDHHNHAAGRCVFCGQPPTPPPPRPRCPRCGGLGITSLTWIGPPGGDLTRWRMDNCEDCGGTGTPTTGGAAVSGPRDELDARIRALEAERLRPIPPAPITRRIGRSDTERRSLRYDAGRVDDIEEHLAEIARRQAVLEELGDDEEGEGGEGERVSVERTEQKSGGD